MIKKCLFMLLCSSIGFACFPITHLRYAEFFIDAFSIREYQNQNLFIIGTFLPKVSCIDFIVKKSLSGGIDKSIYTTEECLSNAVAETDYLQKGAWYHIYIDLMREKIMKQTQIQEKIPELAGEDRFFISLLEDELLYNKRAAMRLYKIYKGLNIREFLIYDSLEKIISLRTLFLEYFKQSPMEMLEKSLVTIDPLITLSRDEIRELLQTMNKVFKKKEFLDYFTTFYSAICDDLVHLMLHENREELEAKWKLRTSKLFPKIQDPLR